MKILKSSIIAATVALSAAMVSCSDSYLDKEVDLTLQVDVVFADYNMTRGFLANCYTYLPDAFSGYGDATKDCMTDNGLIFWRGRTQSVLEDSYDASNHPYSDYWNNRTAGIRACNQFIKNARPSVIGNADRKGDDNHLYDRYIAEARLLRAILTFDMITWFGDVPLFGENEDGEPLILSPGMELPVRTPADEALMWVVNECDKLKNDLPFRYTNEEENWGRVNGAAAYALKSRALLYRASPLYNRSKDASRWKDAAQAAVDFINANRACWNPYRLHTTTDNDPQENYYDCFVTNPVHNNEYILSRSVWRNQNAIENNNAPCGFTGKRSATGNMNPSQNLVDAYEMADGRTIEQAQTAGDYDPQNPYINRDPRMEQTIIHHGTIWGVGDEARPVNVNNDDGEVGVDYARGNGGTCTGYYLKKYTTNIPWDGTVGGTDKACPIFRYAEILLNAAEAYNEAGETSTAYQYVNQVRDRVGMPAYSGMSQAQLRERIQNERRIELCFEDHRFFDVRRWMLYDQNQSRAAEQSLPRYRQLFTIYGVAVRENTAVKYNYGPNEKYPYITFHWQPIGGAPGKNYFIPIPLSEIRKTGYAQNPGWEM